MYICFHVEIDIFADCPTFCTDVYDPLCGLHVSTGKKETFSNRCKFDVAVCQDRDWMFSERGECFRGKHK